MSKVNNLIAWVLVTAATIAWSHTFWQNTRIQQKATTTQLMDTTTYDYKKLLYTDISTLSPEIIQKVMLQRINEIRKEHNLKPLTYDKRLETPATSFAKEKSWTERWNDPDNHFDKDGNWIYERMEKAWLLPHIKLIVVNGNIESIWENLVTTHGSVNDLMNALMQSIWHKERLLSPHENKVGFWYFPWSTILVQMFAQMID